MDLSKLKNGQKIVLGAGILLLINLFLPWYRVDFGIASASINAFDAGFLAWFGSFLAIAAAVIVALKVFANMKINAGPLKAEHLAFGLAALGFLFIFLRLVTEFDFAFIGIWLGLIVSAILAFGAFLAMKEEGLGDPGLQGSRREQPAAASAGVASRFDAARGPRLRPSSRVGGGGALHPGSCQNGGDCLRRSTGASMDRAKLSTGQKLVFYGGLFLIVNLLFIPWYRAGGFVDVGIGVDGFGAGFYAWFGSLCGIAAAGLVYQKATGRLGSWQFKPEYLVLALAATGFVLILVRLITEANSVFLGTILGLLVAGRDDPRGLPRLRAEAAAGQAGRSGAASAASAASGVAPAHSPVLGGRGAAPEPSWGFPGAATRPTVRVRRPGGRVEPGG